MLRFLEGANFQAGKKNFQPRKSKKIDRLINSSLALYSKLIESNPQINIFLKTNCDTTLYLFTSLNYKYITTYLL